jgi:hypothetical protein
MLNWFQIKTREYICKLTQARSFLAKLNPIKLLNQDKLVGEDSGDIKCGDNLFLKSCFPQLQYMIQEACHVFPA